MSKSKKGKKQTEEHRKKAAKARTGLKRSDEFKQKMSEVAKLREERKRLAKQVKNDEVNP